MDVKNKSLADLLAFFQSLGNARKLLLSEICTSYSTMQGSQRALFLRLKAGQDLRPHNHGTGEAHPPHASACPQEIGRWY